MAQLNLTPEESSQLLQTFYDKLAQVGLEASVGEVEEAYSIDKPDPSQVMHTESGEPIEYASVLITGLKVRAVIKRDPPGGVS